MKKLVNTQTGSFFVKESGQVYFETYEQQSAALLAQVPSDTSNDSEINEKVAAFLEAAKEREHVAKEQELDEVTKQNAQRQGFFSRR